MKTKLAVVIGGFRSDHMICTVALLSHVSERPYWLCRRPHSSMVQHLLICNNKFIWAGEYVTTQPPTMREKQKTHAERERETHFIPLHWQSDTKDSTVVASLWPLRFWRDSECRGALTVLPDANPSAEAIWPTVSSSNPALKKEFSPTFANKMRWGLLWICWV